MVSSSLPVPFLFGLIDSSTPYFLVYLLPFALLLPLSIFYLFKNEGDGIEPYVFEHTALNRQPEDGPSKKPDTEWLNMGYWKDTRSFPDACEALARLLLSKANLQPQGRTLDVAHATGDSLLLLKHPDSTYPRQAHLTGITSLADHARRAAIRLASIYPKKGESIDIQCEDAIYRGAKLSAFKQHPLDPERTEEDKFDSVVCLDAAYHFKSRRLWLEQVINHGVKEGGTVAWTDILSADEGEDVEGYELIQPKRATPSDPAEAPRPASKLSQLILNYVLLPLLSVPPRNIVSIPRLAATLLELGYEDVTIEDITGDVFPGFAAFLGGRKELSWRIMGRVVRWWSGGGDGGGRGLLRFVIVTARKPAGEDVKEEGFAVLGL